MAMLLALAVAAFAMAGAMAAAWWVQRRTGNSGWIDAIWTFATGGAAAALSLAPLDAAEAGWRQTLVSLMVAFWSLRLGGHIVRRTMTAHDDPRYAALMKAWGSKAPLRLFLFLQAQAAVGLVLASAVMIAAHRPEPHVSWLDMIAIAVFISGWLIEAISDVQLRQFKARSARGAVCDAGLWSWSRHPNYFGEWLCWCAYPLLAFGINYPLGAVCLVAPAIMYWTLVYASGIPPLEAHMRRSRPQAWSAYARRTAPFFPRPPRD